MSPLVSADEAARMSGVHPKTVRRWIAAGRLRALRRGRTYRINPSDLAPFMEHDGTADEEQSGHSGQDSPGRPDTPGMLRPEMPGIVEALQLVRDLQQQNLELAGRVGYYQAENAQLRERLVLMAPEPTSEGVTPPAPTVRPWWRFW